MRTLVICHDEAPLDREGLPRWLASFSTYVGTVVVHEPPSRLWQRIARERKRVGWIRFADVLAYRAYYAVLTARKDRDWESDALGALRARFPQQPEAPELHTPSPNSADAERFIRDQRPDLVLARCKSILKEGVFALPPLGTFVMHPGICPEYRNAHGCFWAMASGDTGNVGMTLLRADRGVDTGPIFGHFRVQPSHPRESHIVVQYRAVLDHLDAIRQVLVETASGQAVSIDTSGSARRGRERPEEAPMHRSEGPDPLSSR